MADTYDQMKKSYDAAKAIVEDCYTEIQANQRAVGQTTGVIQEGTKEIGLRVQALKDKGAAGTDIKDFSNDAEVKKMLASVEQFLGSLEKELKAIAVNHKAAKTKGVAAYWTIRADLEKEIKDRKKSAVTKLGAGNKSLPDMEKLLAAMKKYENERSFLGVDIFVPETIEQHRKEFGFALKDEIAKSKDLRLTSEQAMLDEQALNERNLAKNLGLAKKALDESTAALKAAKEAVAKKDAGKVKQQQEVIGKALKVVKAIESIFTRAFKDDWIKSKIKDSSIKGKILATSKGITQMREAIEVIDLKARAADL